MSGRNYVVVTGVLTSLLGVASCAPTINVKVAPISIYAKLDANIRIKLDREVESAIQQNPDLFK